MSAAIAEEQIEVYWMPGCSSCLRMKEFVEKTGLPFVAINVEQESGRAVKLKEHGLRVPTICVGDSCVNGVKLADVASLLGVDYTPPVMLSPEELMQRYNTVIDALCRYIAQIPADRGDFTLPNRDRDLWHLAGHAGCTMRIFVGKYEDDAYEGFFDDVEPRHLRDAASLIAYARETQKIVNDWWELDGRDDPLDTVVTMYWGPRTLHEALEREVWHAAQHTRQIMLMLERLGVVVDRPLTADQLSGLPLPERVFD